MKNTHKVPKKQWKEWPDVCRLTFNHVYSTMLLNQSIAAHPDAPVLKKAHWKTVSWNSAWFAADAVFASLKEIARG